MVPVIENIIGRDIDRFRPGWLGGNGAKVIHPVADIERAPQADHTGNIQRRSLEVRSIEIEIDLENHLIISRITLRQIKGRIGAEDQVVQPRLARAQQ